MDRERVRDMDRERVKGHRHGTGSGIRDMDREWDKGQGLMAQGASQGTATDRERFNIMDY